MRTKNIPGEAPLVGSGFLHEQLALKRLRHWRWRVGQTLWLVLKILLRLARLLLLADAPRPGESTPAERSALQKHWDRQESHLQRFF